jgi:cysteine desulfurase
VTARPRASRAYLDHSATTPLRPEVLDVLLPALRAVGNPSSAHASGRARRALLEGARDDLARALGADPVEIVFTSGATEADDLAVAGIALAARDVDPRRRIVVCSAVEHPAVLESADSLAGCGLSTVRLGVDATGRVDLDELSALLATDADSIAVVSVMAANNEVGTVQPLAEIVARCAPYGIAVHADAAQAVGVLPVDFVASGLAALSLTGHKVGGPVGAGALLLRRDVAVRPRTHGGGQERGIRSGTSDAAAAIGLAAAVTAAVRERAVMTGRVQRLRDELVSGVLGRVESSALVGAPTGPDRLPGNAYLAFPGADVEALLFALDSAGIDASAGSACHSGVPRSSHVLEALRAGGADIPDGVRFSLGHTSTAADVESLLAVIAGCVALAREVAAVPA